MHRVGICGMTVIWGMLARLTWWEYSWDVMEPCTFFVTYGGAILCYSYYLGTKTNPDYDDVSRNFEKKTIFYRLQSSEQLSRIFHARVAR